MAAVGAGESRDESARSGAALWSAFAETAGLEPDTSYDRALVTAVARSLRLAWGDDVAEEIERAGVDATAVLIALLGAIEPWAEMMRDLLALLAAQGVSSTQTALRADVDVARASAELNLDLDDFREASELFETIRRDVLQTIWTCEELQELGWSRISPASASDAPIRPAAVAWIEAYERSRQTGQPWPAPPSAPASGRDEELDAALRTAWTGVVERARAETASARDLHELTGRLTPDVFERGRSGDIPIEWIAQCDHDYWCVATLRRMERLAAGRGEPGTGAPGEARELIDLVARLGTAIVPREVRERLPDLLSLPVWRHRYDVYSNWVFTRIVAVLSTHAAVRVEHRDGCIRFGFEAQRLAVCDQLGLSVHCEVRSPLVGSSAERTRGVQPDYSILWNDPEGAQPADSSVAEIECKQYRRAERRRFACALQDYARSRPNARTVALVNYGPVTARMRAGVLATVDDAVSGRCTVVGSLRPRSDEARRTFDGVLAEALELDQRLDVATGTPLEVSLSWRAAGERDDLDLHALMTDREGRAEAVWYARLRADSPGWGARHHGDVRSAPGPERLTIERCVSGTVRIMVHAFSGAGLDRCQPKVVLRSGVRTYAFMCPPGAGETWHVLSLDPETAELTALEERVGAPPGHTA